MAVETPTTLTLANSGPEGARQFQGLFNVIPFTFNFEEDSIAAGAASGGTITVTNAAVGDLVLVALGQAAAELAAFGTVTAADTVQINVANLDLAAADTSQATVAKGKGVVLQFKDNVFGDM
ncbi:MAG: hypothetical protein GTO41_11820 [Burkholderiales bacterium]|nr:hypothetical protein [Burkholderiales bacterium]